MSETLTRALTGAAYVALTLGAALAGPVTTALLFLPVCLQSARELLRLAYNNRAPEPSPALPLAVVMATYLAVAAAGIGLLARAWVPAIVVAAFLVGIAQVLIAGDGQAVRRSGLLLLLITCVAIPFGLITSFFTNGPHLFIGFMLLLWTNDTGAYLVGRAIGRTKLLPQVSPKKTVEGLLGGMVLSVAVGAALARAWPVLTLPQWAACALVVAVASTLGDLLESAFKREAGVKDSGTLLPGHGGLLDRFDGFLLALPAMWACMACFGR